MALSAKKAKLDEILGSRLRDISAAQFRELLLIIGPIVLLIATAVWIASRFIEPAPPKRIAISTASQTGNYFATGKKYADHLAKHGIALEVRTSPGSPENVRRLLDPASGVQVALLQGGTTNSEQTKGLVSLGRVYLEPMWVFYRSDRALDRLADLKGLRIAIGVEGSGTRALALALLKPNGVTAENTVLLALSSNDAIAALQQERADAAFFTSAATSPQVQTLLKIPALKIMSLTHAEAYTRMFPYLSKITLPKGAIDLLNNVPPQDVDMVAPMAALVARDDLHPAHVALLVDATKLVHSPGGLFHRSGEFPKMVDPEFEISDDAERAFRSGPTWLKRTLPFWLASFIERAIVVAVPLAGALIPMIKIGPAIYKWRIRRRLLYWYGRLKALESAVAEDVKGETLEEQREEITTIDAAVSNIPIPVGFSDQYYSLRAAIDLVRQRLFNRAVLSNSSMG